MKNWNYRKFKIIAFEGGEVPSSNADLVGFIIPTISYVTYRKEFMYGKMLTFHFWKWYVGIKWNFRAGDY